MKRLCILLAALMLSACTAAEPTRCDLNFERDIAFTTADSMDTVSVRSFGPSCQQLVGLFTVYDPDGDPIWAWAAPISYRFGDAFADGGAETAQAFLERWSQPRLDSTASAPSWPLPSTASTTLDQATYEDIRARELPMLCHYVGTARELCVFWEPAAAGAGLLFEQDQRNGEDASGSQQP